MSRTDPATVLSSHPYMYSPLCDVATPMCLDDVALQMEMLAADNSDIEVCHMEVDRLLLVALHILADSTASVDDRQQQVKAVVNSFYTVRKWYA